MEESDFDEEDRGGHVHGFVEAGHLDTYRRSRSEKRDGPTPTPTPTPNPKPQTPHHFT